ncbi:MAG: hypothetical protein ACOCZJ_02405 [Thermoplasmatota archaeon]
MGFSISSTHLVFFLASMLIASTLAGVFIATTDSISDGIVEKENSISNRLKTNIDVINDPNNVPNDPLTIYVKNTGSTKLNKTDVNILVNGTMQNSVTKTVLDGGPVWDQNEVLKIEVNKKLPAGDHWVKVVVGNDVQDSLEFSI